MENLNREEFKMSIDERQKLSTEEHAHICTMIMSALRDKLKEMKELFEQLSNTYGMEMAATGISIVCNIDAIAFADPMNVFMSGSTDGLMHNFKHLTSEIVKVSDNIISEQLQEMSDDEETD